MRSVPWRWLLVMAVCGFLIAVAFAPDPTTSDLSTWPNDVLVSTLSHSNPNVRREVVRQLVSRARTVMPTLEHIAENPAHPNFSDVYEILQELMLSSDLSVSETAESTLERLMQADNRLVADAALKIVFGNAMLRHARALLQFRDRGGAFAYEDEDPALKPADTQVYLPRIVVLDRRWTGGDEGLKYVGRLYPSEPLTVHVGRDATVSEGALRRLQSSRAYVAIRREGESCLGIFVDVREESRFVRVSEVTRGSPADLAGILPGDVLHRFDGRPTHTLMDLRELSMRRQPGDLVEVRIRRRSKRLRIKLALGSDFRTGECQCVATDPRAQRDPQPAAPVAAILDGLVPIAEPALSIAAPSDALHPENVPDPASAE